MSLVYGEQNLVHIVDGFHIMSCIPSARNITDIFLQWVFGDSVNIFNNIVIIVYSTKSLYRLFSNFPHPWIVS